MRKTLLLLSAAAAFTFASCSENKTADTTTTTAADGTSTTTTTTTTTTSYSTDAIERRADRIAADMAAKMKFDDATRTKVRTVYVTRGQRLGELQQKYAADTTGRAAAMREVYNNSDLELKTIFTDPTQYSAYEASRVDYMDDRYMDDTDMATSDMSTSASASGTGTESMESGKTKAEDGSKVKVKADGDVKIKDAEGNKLKVDADDATIKSKPEDGDKSVIK